MPHFCKNSGQSSSKSAAITVIELGYGGVRNFLPAVVDVHQHLLALLWMTVFGIVFAFGGEHCEGMSRFIRHRAVAPAVWDLVSAPFGIGGPLVGRPSVLFLPIEENRHRGSLITF